MKYRPLTKDDKEYLLILIGYPLFCFLGMWAFCWVATILVPQGI